MPPSIRVPACAVSSWVDRGEFGLAVVPFPPDGPGVRQNLLMLRQRTMDDATGALEARLRSHCTLPGTAPRLLSPSLDPSTASRRALVRSSSIDSLQPTLGVAELPIGSKIVGEDGRSAAD